MPNGFSIIVPTYNRAELLRTALESIQAMRVPEGRPAEVLVIDNNCTDHTANIVEGSGRSGPLEVRHIVETKQGASHSRNRALNEAKHEHLVYLDDDMVVDEGWLEGYLDAYTAFQPDLVVGPVEPWFEEPPGQLLTQKMLDTLTSAYSRKGEEMIVLPAAQGGHVPGCNFAVLRQAAIEVGGFETRIDRSGAGMLGGGDSELGEKIILIGKVIAYAPRCRIRHFISRKKMSRPAMRIRWEGMGASKRALMRLRGEEPSFARKVRLFMRMNKFLLRSLRSHSTRNHSASYQWELEARQLYGFLFKCPSFVTQRDWPPVPF